jgi:hypothetical protein
MQALDAELEMLVARSKEERRHIASGLPGVLNSSGPSGPCAFAWGWTRETGSLAGPLLLVCQETYRTSGCSLPAVVPADEGQFLAQGAPE